MPSLLNTKKQSPPTPRTAAEHPDVIENERRRSEAKKQLGEVERKLRKFSGGQQPLSRIEKITKGLLTKIRGESEPEPEPTEDTANLTECEAALKRALETIEAEGNGLRLSLAGQIYEAHYAEPHREKRAAVVKAVITLAESINAEREFASVMFQVGALTDSKFGSRLLINCSMIPGLWAAFKHLSNKQGIKDFARDNKNLLT